MHADTGPDSARCAALKALQASGMRLQITGAESTSAMTLQGPPGAPAVSVPVSHCRVDGVIDQRTGVDGRPYAIGFAVALPANWNGRFLMVGGGGFNGAVAAPIGDFGPGAGEVGPGGNPPLMRGFAVVTTDTGHAGTTFDTSFFADQEATLNYFYRALDKVTVAAKQVVSTYYGKAPHHSYFAGCSTGGREAMMMSQRFPDYYDGVLAGAPGMRNMYSTLAQRWVATALNNVAPKDADGQPQTSLALSDQDRRLVVEGVLAACDARDGMKDGLVSAPRSCHFDPAVLACKGSKAEGCLSKPQIDAVKMVMSGPRTSDGRQVYPGYYWDTGIDARSLPGPLVGATLPKSGPVFDATLLREGTVGTMDVDAAAAEAGAGVAMLWDTYDWTNLSTFRGRGGKLIFFHGVSDPLYSALDTAQYYERLGKDNGSAPLTDWSRLFLVPGMGHCGGGARTLDSFELLDPLIAWVEQGQAPERVEAHGRSMPGVTRPLCPYPKHAHYTGSGDPSIAASYACRE